MDMEYALLKGRMIMRQIIPFKKELPFKTKVSDITSISLERKIDILDGGIVTGIFYITGDYKMNEGSINREDFSFDLPFDITLDPRYDISTVKADIEDFYYDIINEDTLKVNIDLFIEAEYLPVEEDKSSDVNDNVLDIDSDTADDKGLVEDTDDLRDIKDISSELIEEDKSFKENIINNVNTNTNVNVNDNVNTKDDSVDKRDDNFASDLFSNLDNTETYSTYYVYVVKDDDTIDKIMSLYGVSKEDIEYYNDIGDIKPGDKIIIPKASE